MLFRHIHLLALSLLLLCSANSLFAQPARPQLLTYQSDASVQLNLVALQTLAPGDPVDFLTADGRSYTVTFDSQQRNKSGSLHWIGHLADAGSDYRVIITWNVGGFGNIHTPDGDFLLETRLGNTRLIDLTKSPRSKLPMGDDIRTPLLPLSPVSGLSNAAAEIPTGIAQIDVMVLYTPGLVSLWGADQVRTRIEHLVALANQAYSDSQVQIQLRLVAINLVNYSDSTAINTALTDLQNSSNPALVNPAFTNISSLRSSYGADLVTLLRPHNLAIDPTNCGLGVLAGSSGQPLQASDGFSVVNDGINCSDYTFAHELGHNMGSAHDRAHSGGSKPFYSYAYGYGIEGSFGTIMSYINPTVGKFSNPNLSCSATAPCGVNENDLVNGANNALSLNNLRWTVAGFMPATGLDTTPDGFSLTTLEGVQSGATVVSETIHISGMSVAAPISILGGQYSIDGAAYTSLPATINNGQTVQVRVTASTTPYASAVAYLSVGMLTQAFRVISGPATIVAPAGISAGLDHSLALRADGTVWSWGGNGSGQLGDGTLSSHALPAQITSLSNVVSIAAGQSISIAAISDGSVRVWGANGKNQLSDGTTTDSAQPKSLNGVSGIVSVASGGFRGFGLTGTGNVWTWGYGYPAPVQISLGRPAIAIAGGSNHGMALLDDGSVWVWGDNSHGQLGNNGVNNWAFTPVQVAGLSNVTAIAAGANHNLALKSDGSVWAWGDNSHGQLGDGTTIQRNSPVAVAVPAAINSIFSGCSADYNLALTVDGTLLAWGRNNRGQLGDGIIADHLTPVAPQGTTNLVRAATGGLHSLALKNDGSVISWGANWTGQLGNGDPNGPDMPVPGGVGEAGWLIGAANNMPAKFSFSALASAMPGSSVITNTITISGITLAAPISITGGSYSLDGGAFTTTNGVVQNGQQLRVQLLAPAVSGQTQAATLVIGGVSGTISVTTTSLQTANLSIGWNLLGNSVDAPLDVAISLGDLNKVVTVWKWLPTNSKWAFYAPAMNATELGSYAASKSYEVLSAIGGGEGYWVNAKTAFAIQLPVGTTINTSRFVDQKTPPNNLPPSWSLIAVGDNPSPRSFVNSISLNSPTAPAVAATSLTSLWAWDSIAANWYFYAPALDNSSGLNNYITSKGYLNFYTPALKTLSPTTGFWVNHP